VNRAQRLDAWLADHVLVVALVMSGWFALAAWHLVPAGLVTPDGHLIDPSTTDPHGYNVWAYAHFAYSDIYRLYAERNLYGHPLPYLHARIEYPVITGLFMWLASFAPGANGDFVASAVGLWLAGLVSLFGLRRLLPRRYHWFGLSPLLFVFSLLNWDLLGICFLVVGLVMVRDERFTLAGVALALGTCAKLFPVVLVPFLVTRLVRDEGFGSTRLRGFVTGFAAACVVVNAPFAIAAFHNWSFFFSFNAVRSGSGVLGVLGSHQGIEDALIGLVVLAVLGIGIRSVLRGGSVERAATLTFVVFLLVNKVYSPQYTLWLFVFALVAEWPLWTLGMLWLVGIGDYFGQFADLYITNTSVGSNAVTTWWASNVGPWESRLRDLGIVAASFGAWLGRPGPPEPVPARRTSPVAAVAHQGDALLASGTEGR